MDYARFHRVSVSTKSALLLPLSPSRSSRSSPSRSSNSVSSLRDLFTETTSKEEREKEGGIDLSLSPRFSNQPKRKRRVFEFEEPLVERRCTSSNEGEGKSSTRDKQTARNYRRALPLVLLPPSARARPERDRKKFRPGKKDPVVVVVVVVFFVIAVLLLLLLFL